MKCLKILFLMLQLCGGLCFYGCSGKSDNADVADTETTNEDNAVLAHAPASVLDSLALNADDLTPQQAVSLLTGYVEIYRTSSSSRAKAVTMRKFVDVYDILISNYGDEFRNAVTRAVTGELNLREVSQEFRTKLAGYDEASGAEYEAPAPRDTTQSAPVDTASVSSAD